MKKTIILILAALVAFVAPSMISGYSEVSAQTVKKAKQKSEIKASSSFVHFAPPQIAIMPIIVPRFSPMRRWE